MHRRLGRLTLLMLVMLGMLMMLLMLLRRVLRVLLPIPVLWRVSRRRLVVPELLTQQNAWRPPVSSASMQASHIHLKLIIGGPWRVGSRDGRPRMRTTRNRRRRPEEARTTNRSCAHRHQAMVAVARFGRATADLLLPCKLLLIKQK